MQNRNNEEVPFHKKPLYFWIKSFAEKEIGNETNFSNFVTSNALTYALEYIGLNSENEQSSLHLSAIFDEESHQQSSRRYPNHFESETKSRIQSLNRTFIELKSYFEDNFSQLIAFRPPNTVHISSACETCSIHEFEKFLLLVLGASIQGNQKQDTIRKIKKFPTEVQESLIESIKLIDDNPDLIKIKSWTEFSSLESKEQFKVYESLLGLIRRLLMERNEAIQNQLISDYYSGYINCHQKKVYEGKGFGIDQDFEDSRNTLSLRHLKEELNEKSELLQECREELETARNHVQELTLQLTETQQVLKSCKKARDELDALREGHEKASRLETELVKMKKKLEDSEHYIERSEVLQNENRSLQLKHDLLLDQISFLTIEKSNRREEASFDFESFNSPEIEDDEIEKDSENRIFPFEGDIIISDDEDEVDNETNELFIQKTKSVHIDNVHCTKKVIEFELSEDVETKNISDQETNNDNDIIQSNDILNIQPEPTPPLKEKSICQLEIQLSSQSQNQNQNQNQPYKRTKRQRRRLSTSTLNIKRTRKGSILKNNSNTKSQPSGERLSENQITIKKKSPTRTKSFKRRQQNGNEKQVVPNLDIENDADEELSLSPNGLPNVSDEDEDSPIARNEIEGKDEKLLTSSSNLQLVDENDSDIYFVCSSTKSNKTHFSLLSKNLEATRTIPLLQMTNGNEELDNSEAELNLSDCTIQVNLRNHQQINIPDNNNNPEPKSNGILHFQLHGPDDESSSEEDDSVWFEYGCV